MLNHAQRFEQGELQKCYSAEEAESVRRVRKVAISEVPKSANIKRGHTPYEINTGDTEDLGLKAIIVPHVNGDKERNLRTECCMCPPDGVRVILSTAALLGWNIAKEDAEAALLKTGRAVRDVYVIAPRECRERAFYWLLLTAA